MNLDLWRAALRSLAREPSQTLSEALYSAQALLDRAEPLRVLGDLVSPCPRCTTCGQPTVPHRLVEVELGRICFGCYVRTGWERVELGDVGASCVEENVGRSWWWVTPCARSPEEHRRTPRCTEERT